MARETVLVVDDEKDILELVEYNLTRNGYKVYLAVSGEQALEQARRSVPDLIVLDLMLPGVDGLEVCRVLRADARTKQVPILMLTAKGEDADVVAGLELGADDYMTKPFSPRVLLARIKSVLRRKGAAAPLKDTGLLKVGLLVMDPGRHEALVGDKRIDLTFTEFKTLYFLARRPGWVFTRYQIVDGAQGEDAAVTERSVDVHIASLRRKLGELGGMIETVRGVGYRLKEV